MQASSLLWSRCVLSISWIFSTVSLNSFWGHKRWSRCDLPSDRLRLKQNRGFYPDSVSFGQTSEDETFHCVLTFTFSSSLLFAFVTHSVTSSRSIFFVTSTSWRWSWPNISRLGIRNQIKTFTLTNVWAKYFHRILLIHSRSKMKPSLLLFHPWKCSFANIYLRYDWRTHFIKMKRLRISFIFCSSSSRMLNIWLWQHSSRVPINSWPFRWGSSLFKSLLTVSCRVSRYSWRFPGRSAGGFGRFWAISCMILDPCSWLIVSSWPLRVSWAGGFLVSAWSHPLKK